MHPDHQGRSTGSRLIRRLLHQAHQEGRGQGEISTSGIGSTASILASAPLMLSFSPRELHTWSTPCAYVPRPPPSSPPPPSRWACSPRPPRRRRRHATRAGCTSAPSSTTARAGTPARTRR
ncbi:hypothetical protein [Streptomyces atriruber]|uniref:hypothetical protein n=1 Tax=Streptomyces atriruber TaxID=545121 RepID=UPI003CC513CB